MLGDQGGVCTCANQCQNHGDDVTFFKTFVIFFDTQQRRQEVILYRSLTTFGNDFLDDIDGLVAVLTGGFALLVGNGRIPGFGEGNNHLFDLRPVFFRNTDHAGNGNEGNMIGDRFYIVEALGFT